MFDENVSVFFLYHTEKGSTVKQSYKRDRPIERGCDGPKRSVIHPGRGPSTLSLCAPSPVTTFFSIKRGKQSVGKKMVTRRRRRRRTVHRLRRRWPRGMGLADVLGKAAAVGYSLGKSKRYRRMGAKGATGHYERLPTPWMR